MDLGNMLRAVLPFLCGVGLSQLSLWAWKRWKGSRYCHLPRPPE